MVEYLVGARAVRSDLTLAVSWGESLAYNFAPRNVFDVILLLELRHWLTVRSSTFSGILVDVTKSVSPFPLKSPVVTALDTGREGWPGTECARTGQ